MRKRTRGAIPAHTIPRTERDIEAWLFELWAKVDDHTALMRAAADEGS